MKRCPECQFIYPDTDRVCDFDQSPLVEASESEIAAITNTPERIVRKQKSRRFLPVAIAIGLLLGITGVGVYVAVRRQMRPQPIQEQVSSRTPVHALPSASPSVSIIETPSPEVVVTKSENSATPNTKDKTAHTTTSTGPVSTGTASGSKSGKKQVILLTSGGRVEADEVWRTKDGVWYRRAGVVTLLKKDRVKAIVSQ